MPKHLVIVESPAKARTLSKFLGKDYMVEASIGHIRDLPSSAAEIPEKYKSEKWSRLGVDISNDFDPLYVIPHDKKKQVQKLKALLKTADHLYLATDEDREGEAISWHLMEALKPGKKVSRLVFHEITKQAILEALENTRDIDLNLVQAQETRRVLDRLYGYQISPLLWKKIAPRLSAGRVQSVTIRLVVDREKDRSAFVESEYWDLKGMFQTTSQEVFPAALREVGGKKVAAGKDFDPYTGKLKGNKLIQLDQNDVEKLKSQLEAASWSVDDVVSKPVKQYPSPPFTTSSLQQQAGGRLGMSARETMRVAQSLYENGFITYMRTDSVALAKGALDGIRRRIKKEFGDKYVPEKPRYYKSKVKNAQEAHEAIRPAGMEFPRPSELRGQLNPRELKLYELIWKRTIACQMPEAHIQQTTVDVKGGSALFRATGKVIEFDGFLRVYPRFAAKTDGNGQDNGDEAVTLPILNVGDSLKANELITQPHTTKPPARFTEASLIKELEALGIGRPSTYAAIIETILRREYVFKRGTALIPTFVAYAVVKLMQRHFERLVDPEFTAQMEDDLDAISRGEAERTPYLKDFYFGEDGWEGLEKLIKQDIDPREMCTIEIGTDKDGNEINVRIGKYGPFLERGEDRAKFPDSLAPDELTVEKAEECFANEANGNKALGHDTLTGEPVFLLNGRFGPYVQLGERSDDKKAPKPKQKSLLPGMEPGDVTLDVAQEILRLPRELGVHPERGETIVADLGRYGPYLKCGTDSRSLTNADSILEIDLKRAVEIYSQEKKAGSFSRTTQALRELGTHPDRPGVNLKILNGRFGPYITDGSVNVSVPRGSTVEELTMEEAVSLYEQKLLAGPAKTRGRKKTAASDTTAMKRTKKTVNKVTAKRTAAKRTGVKKSTGKKTSR